MSKRLTNTTGTVIALTTIGLSISPVSTIVINPEDYLLLASVESITELTPFINSGDIVVADEIAIISETATMIEYLKYPDHASSSRFLKEGRGHGLTATNTQEAIEELRFNKRIETEDICIPADHVLQVHSSVFLGELKLDGEAYIL